MQTDGQFSFSATIHEELSILTGAISECSDPQELDYDAIVAELERHSTQIHAAHKSLKKSHNILQKRVIEARDEVKRKEAELQLLSSWPLQIADEAQKWIDVWESEFGKRMLSNNTNQLAENAIIVEQIGQTVDYCRRMIYAKRESQERWRNASCVLRGFSDNELRRLQREIVELRSQILDTERRLAENNQCVAELRDHLKQLELLSLEKRVQLDEASADNRFEREHCDF